jgi:ATP-dependent helicase STH1/SNF2
MKQQGVPETNPEFIKARNLLSMVQKHNQFAQMKRMQQQQQQRQQSISDPQAMQQNGAAMAMSNGAKPPGSVDGSVSTPVSSGLATTTQIATASGQAPASDGQTPTSATSANGALSKDQLMMLRAQIGAFKHLSKGLPLPGNMQQQIYGHQTVKKPQTVAWTVLHALRVPVALFKSHALCPASRIHSSSHGAAKHSAT